MFRRMPARFSGLLRFFLCQFLSQTRKQSSQSSRIFSCLLSHVFFARFLQCARIHMPAEAGRILGIFPCYLFVLSILAMIFLISFALLPFFEALAFDLTSSNFNSLSFFFFSSALIFDISFDFKVAIFIFSSVFLPWFWVFPLWTFPRLPLSWTKIPR